MAVPLVRSSSSCRCGSQRVQKVRSCKVCACSPARDRKAGDGRLAVAEDPLSGGRIQPTSRAPSVPRRPGTGGRFQTVQGGVASGSERHVAGLAAKRLDALGMAMRAIPDQGVDMSICDAGVGALLVGTGEALGVHSLGCSPAAFDLTPGAHRRRSRSHTISCTERYVSVAKSAF